MSVLYIGQYEYGTTSRMRGEKLKKVLEEDNFDVINTSIPFFSVNKLYQSFGFRFKRGPVIKSINSFINQNVKGYYDLIWVDKGVFLTRETTICLRNKAKKLVHFTPDTAFLENKSSHFNQSLPLYDFAITTKSFEVQHYQSFLKPTKIITTTQGFDKDLHFPQHPFSKKEDKVIFIGLHELSRELLLTALLGEGIAVELAGYGWGRFVKKHKNISNFRYLGKAVYAEEYASHLSSAYFGLGMLAKRFPELHTTRTFEIPACGTALLTEANQEITSIFKPDEAVFFKSSENLINQIFYFQKNKSALECLTKKGHLKVTSRGYDYDSLLKKIVRQIGL